MRIRGFHCDKCEYKATTKSSLQLHFEAKHEQEREILNFILAENIAIAYLSVKYA